MNASTKNRNTKETQLIYSGLQKKFGKVRESYFKALNRLLFSVLAPFCPNKRSLASDLASDKTDFELPNIILIEESDIPRIIKTQTCCCNWESGVPSEKDLYKSGKLLLNCLINKLHSPSEGLGFSVLRFDFLT